MTVRVGLAHVRACFSSQLRPKTRPLVDNYRQSPASEKKRERETVARSTIRPGKPLFAAAETSSANSNNEIVTVLLRRGYGPRDLQQFTFNFWYLKEGGNTHDCTLLYNTCMCNVHMCIIHTYINYIDNIVQLESYITACSLFLILIL